MITLQQWGDLVKEVKPIYYWCDDKVVSANINWFSKMQWLPDEKCFTVGAGRIDQWRSLDDIYLSEQECAQDQIRKIKQLYCKEA